ncbi:LuxR family transcriptional regulator [Bradyrhizobium canariense]|uniref:Transcriptional regulator n=1 Tax=Bradyrhizobium canariense TaxID=255045 RepID=A0A1X3GQM2_9BRAD|nr:LuxR family transcriptional regulator [Bradyrhizobium canariense]OSI73185.1 transcriptional regulator [Bradyrhizobium canariense]OSI81287.1 transcriptional regulator [Bradyrhizobium canariense]OSI94562.1 transcriptional regulator [Bradyrhizobium canariense]OSI95150.1 transcriptional regulator [Bradyrhizobium canariense]OSJ08195.1 transcriptional regulator [Bradyrhizobium canariense]
MHHLHRTDFALVIKPPRFFLLSPHSRRKVHQALTTKLLHGKRRRSEVIRLSAEHRIFQQFIEQLVESSDPISARQSMADFSAALDLHCFAYLALPHEPGTSPNLISTYPSSWTALYFRRGYESIDPVVRQAIQQSEPFRWGLGFDPEFRPDAERELFEDAAAFGIRCGFTFPIHDNGAVAALTFATDAPRPVFERSLDKYVQSLRLISMIFHTHARRFWTSDRVVGGVVLSPRELECLGWSSRGKSAGEIGIILGISERTASFHLDNARAKLGVRSLRQAVALLAESRSKSRT